MGDRRSVIAFAAAAAVVAWVVGTAVADSQHQQRRRHREREHRKEQPESTVPAVDDPTYQEVCGACHFPLQPALLPSRSWQLILAGTQDHFGQSVGLEAEHRLKPVGRFSKGMKQRVKLAQALIHEPDLLVLDEPMNGLDPMGRREISDLLLELAEAGTHILISSHILPELESLCGQLVMMNWGRVLAAGSQQHIRNDLHTWSERVTIRCDRPNVLVRHFLDGGLIRGFEIEPDSDTVILTLQDPPDFYRRWTEVVIESKVAVFEVRSETRSLNQIFERMTT